MDGLITKGIGGFYYVLTDAGLVETKGRGIFKKDGITLTVGDRVKVSLMDEEKMKGVIEEILPRKNQFIRPPIANVDLFIVVAAAAKPKPNFAVIDKFLIMAEMKDVEVVICLNKCDLAREKELAEFNNIYAGVYPVICTSSKTGQGIDELKTFIKGKKAALAGPSGVGKSTILNLLHPEANMETGEISEKTKRGKHTTRHVEIFQVEGGGMVYDTPGFTSFDILEAEEENLMNFYPEIDKLRNGCRYDDCKHVKEPECAVRKAVQDGYIHNLRYESYIANMEEIRQRKKY